MSVVVLSLNHRRSRLNFIVGSFSPLKRQAVERALQALGFPDAVVVSAQNIKSGVNHQPCGCQETSRGALNRARQAQNQKPDYYAIGIESGIISCGDNWVDVAYLTLITPTGQTICGQTAGMFMPKEAAEEARARGFTSCTVGEVLAERQGGDPKDPHSMITGDQLSRCDVLAEGIRALLASVLVNRQATA